MSKLTSFFVTIQGGRIGFKSEHHRDLWRRFLSQFEGQTVRVWVDEEKPKRSEEQNRFYWLYLGILADETGYSKDELHEWAKGKFLGGAIVEVFGDKVRRKKSTTELTKAEFVEFIMNIEEVTGVPAPDTSAFYSL